jgi:hypothetical protein
MKVKGTVLTSVAGFVKDNFPNREDEWLDGLPSKSKDIFSSAIMAANWYDFEAGLLEPSLHAAQLFYEGQIEKAGWEMGRHSAEVGLKGIYKVFVLVASPQFLMRRSSRVLSSFYQPSVVKVSHDQPNTLNVCITEFEGSHPITEARIGGWMEKALEICGGQSIQVQIPKSIAEGDEETLYTIRWE